LYVLALADTSLDEKDREAADVATLNAPPDTLLAHADELLADEKRKRIGRRFNWVLSTFDVGSLLFGAPRAPDLSSAQGVVSEWGSGKEPAPRERKALVLYREFLRRAPEDPRAADIAAKMEELETRRKTALLEAELSRAEAAFQDKDYWGANFHYHLALMIDESATKARAGLAQVEAALQTQEDLDGTQSHDPFSGVKQAEWEHDKQTLTYLLPGSGFVKDNFVVAGTQIATEGLAGAATFGALTLIQTTAKLFRLFTGNPVPQEKVITEGEKYVHDTPTDERNPEIYLLLAKAYEKEGRIDKAITYYQLAGESELIPRLQERAGDALLQMAKQSPHQAQKEMHLRALIERYPKTKAAKEAAPLLRELQLPANRGLQLTKAFLKEHDDLINPESLGLKRDLFDGNPDNVELTDEGLTLLPNGEIALRLQSDTGPRTKVYAVPDERWEQFWRRFREKGYDEAATRGDRGLALLAQGAEAADLTLKSSSEQNERDGWKTLPYLSGGLSGSHIDLRGTLPKEILGTRLSFGNDQRSSYLGVEVPMPFIPVDFLFLGRNGTPSLYPQIRLPEKALKDEELYR
jgi:tetratricopeptide (TPR) repeat protein